MKLQISRIVRSAAPYIVSLAVFLLLWEGVTRLILERLNPLSRNILPAPSIVAQTGYNLLVSGTLFTHIATSFKRVVVGYGWAVGLGLPIGVAAGLLPVVREQIQPVLRLLRPIPPFAWIPLALLWFGIGDMSAFFVVFVGSVFAVVQYTVFGFLNVDRTLLRAARNLGARGWQMVRRVLLPAAAPRIFSGLRVAWGFGWMVVVAAELLGSSAGLGFLIMDSRNLGRPDIALVAMVAIAGVAFSTELLLVGLENLTLRWRE